MTTDEYQNPFYMGGGASRSPRWTCDSGAPTPAGIQRHIAPHPGLKSSPNHGVPVLTLPGNTATKCRGERRRGTDQCA